MGHVQAAHAHMCREETECFANSSNLPLQHFTSTVCHLYNHHRKYYYYPHIKDEETHTHTGRPTGQRHTASDEGEHLISKSILLSIRFFFYGLPWLVLCGVQPFRCSLDNANIRRGDLDARTMTL